ncbi:hypothetical protein IAE22_28095, partial [Bacillus sp. S34]|nr:hypothetical protein [Bacillus sp. S34]
AGADARRGVERRRPLHDRPRRARHLPGAGGRRRRRRVRHGATARRPRRGDHPAPARHRRRHGRRTAHRRARPPTARPAIPPPARTRRIGGVRRDRPGPGGAGRHHRRWRPGRHHAPRPVPGDVLGRLAGRRALRRHGGIGASPSPLRGEQHVPSADRRRRPGVLGHVARALTVRRDAETGMRTFIADASHELRTPIATVRAYAELTASSSDVPERVASSRTAMHAPSTSRRTTSCTLSQACSADARSV